MQYFIILSLFMREISLQFFFLLQLFLPGFHVKIVTCSLVFPCVWLLYMKFKKHLSLLTVMGVVASFGGYC